MTPLVTAVVPTVGRSAHLAEALESLRAQPVPELEIVLVSSGGELHSGIPSSCDRIIDSPSRLGFSEANNLGLAKRGPYCLLLNDDATIEEGWLPAALDYLESRSRAAAIQGINRRTQPRDELDGYGIGWRRPGWQATQLGHGRRCEAIDLPVEPFEIFGVSATAALFRSRALDEVLLEGDQVFDRRLDTYYEDVDLALRLRAAGWTAHCHPSSSARHRGGASAHRLGTRRLELLYGNRYLVLARAWGEDFRAQRAEMVRRDLKDCLRRPRSAPGILKGWARARRRWSEFAHSGEPAVTPAELARFEVFS